MGLNIGKHKYFWVLNIIRCVYLKVNRWYLNKIRSDKKKKYPNTLILDMFLFSVCQHIQIRTLNI